MEENNRLRNYGENVITLKKITANMIHYWWVLASAIGIPLLLIIFVTVSRYRRDNEGILSDSYVEDNLCQASTMLYMEGLEEKQDDLDTLSDPYRTYIKLKNEQWQWEQSNQFIYDSTALLSSNQVKETINEILIKHGFDGYDPESEELFTEIIPNSRCYKVTARGKDAEKIEFLADTAGGALIRYSSALFGVENCKIIDKAKAYSYRTDNDGIKLIPLDLIESEKTVSALSLSSFVSIENVLFIFMGAFIGAVILLLIILRDRRLYTLAEFLYHFDIPVIGVLHNKKDWSQEVQLETMAALVLSRSEKECFKDVLIGGAGGAQNKGRLLEHLQNRGGESVRMYMHLNDYRKQRKSSENAEGLAIVDAGEVLCLPEAIEAFGTSDKILLIVALGVDRVTELYDIFHYIDMTAGSLLGCILEE